jgi:hypothetical protein
MSALRYAIDKVTSTIALLVELQSTDFPYPGPEEALQQLESLLKDRLTDLSAIDPKTSAPEVANETIKHATNDVTTALEFAGYIINSSNVRNIFEVHSPLLHIAQHLIVRTQPVQLILSFEWNYVPFTYPLNVPELPNFVVIGLPASESFNSLIIPAAGHELGHSIWRVKDLDTKFSVKVTNSIVSLIRRNFWDRYREINPDVNTKAALKDKKSKSTWGLSYVWALRQLQEVYCDLIGLGLFGEAYLHTFKYLIAPSISSDRPETYPTSRQRAEYLVRASKSNPFKVNVPPNYLKSFEDEQAASEPKEYRLLLDIADSCTSEVFPIILKEAADFLTRKSHKAPPRARWKKITADFKNLVPTSQAPSLADIINAGWDVYHDKKFLKELDHTDEEWKRNLDHRRLSMINELVLKSVEIFEIENYKP